MSDGGYLLPEEIDPPRKCFTLEIPDEPFHRAAFFGALESLTKWWNWQRDENHTAAEVTRVWRDVIERALSGDIDCAEGTLQTVNFCREFYPRSPFIDFQPASPFRTDEDQIPFGYAARPWALANSTYVQNYPLDWLQDAGTALINLFSDFQNEDVLSLYLSQPASSVPNGFPRFSVSVEGTGTVELHMLNVPLGGRCVVSVDVDLPDVDDILAGNIDFGKLYITETNWDAFAFPPETAQVVIHEIELDTPGEHVIHVTVVPVLNDELIFIQYGAGLRKVVLCGDDLRPIFPPGREGEGEIIVSDPCGCDGVSDIVRQVGLAMAYGISEDWSGSEVDEDGVLKIPTGGKRGGYDPEIPLGFTDQQVLGGQAIRAATEFVVAVNYIVGWMEETDCFDAGVWAWATECQSYVTNIASSVYDLDFDALGDFLLWYSSQSEVLSLYPPEALAQYLFCDGVRPEALARYAVFELSDTDRDGYILLSRVFLQGQWDYWASLGDNQPVNNPAIYPCFINETVTFEIASGAELSEKLNGNALVNLGTLWEGFPPGRKIGIAVSGSFVWSDGYVRDLFYRVNGHTDGSVETASYVAQFLTGSSLKPADNFVPAYNENHQYQWVAEVGGAGDYTFKIWPNENAPREGEPDIVGSMTITLTDLGQS